MSNNIFLQATAFQLLENWSVQYLLETKFYYNPNYELVSIGNFLIKSRNKIKIEDKIKYQRVTVKINNGGVIPRNTEIGVNIGTKQQYLTIEGQFIMSKIDARSGALGLVPKELDGAIVTNDFPLFDVDKTRINPEFLVLITTTKAFAKFAQSCSSGTTNRQRIDVNMFLNVKIPLPSLNEQNRIVQAYNKKIKLADKQEQEAEQLEKGIEDYLFEELGYKKKINTSIKNFRTIRYSELKRWDFNGGALLESKFTIKKVGNIISFISTGTTPPTNRKEYFENGKVNFYAPGDLGEELFLNNAERKISEIAISEKKARIFERGTLLFVGIGSTVGKVGIVNTDFASSNQQITGLLFKTDDIDVIYVYYYFEYFTHITTKEKTQATIPIVNQGKILNIPIPVPPLSIQKEIVETITTGKTRIKRLKQQAVENRKLALKEFEQEIFTI